MSKAGNKTGRWFYSKEDMHNSPSRKDGIDQFTELRYRQAAAQLIQECGKRLQLTQLTINTAIVFMHRFFMMHSLKRFDKCDIAGAAVFLAAKVEETPRKIQHVICVRDAVQRHGKNLPEQKLDTNSDEYKKRVDILVEHELIMLQTFGFDISIDHPHTHVIRATQFMRAPRELSQVAYFMATNSLNLTTFCLEFRSEIVAATCIYLAFKWSEFEVSLAQDGRPWWAHLDKNLTEEQLIENVRAYIQILEEHPTKLKEMKKQCESQNTNPNPNHSRARPDNNSIGSRPSHSGFKSEPGNDAARSQKRSNDRENDKYQINKRIKTEKREHYKQEHANVVQYAQDTKPNHPILPPVKMPGQSKGGPIAKTQQHDRDHRRSAPGHLQPSGSGINTRDDAMKILHNRSEGESILKYLSHDFAFLKECLKNKEIWTKLSDEEKNYCCKAKEKMKQRREREKRDKRKTEHGSNPTREPPSRGPPPPSETKAATDSLLNDDFN